jgi:hypothetical protein
LSNTKYAGLTLSAASVTPPPTPDDLLTIPVDAYYDAASVGLGAFTAAQKALPSFRNEIHREHPKTFIVTGNILPFSQYSPPAYHTLGLQKALQTRFVATAAKAYESENFRYIPFTWIAPQMLTLTRFYFATLVSKQGGMPGPAVLANSAATHAQVYWNLINNVRQEDWDHRYGFVFLQFDVCSTRFFRFTIDGDKFPVESCH